MCTYIYIHIYIYTYIYIHIYIYIIIYRISSCLGLRNQPSRSASQNRSCSRGPREASQIPWVKTPCLSDHMPGHAALCIAICMFVYMGISMGVTPDFRKHPYIYIEIWAICLIFFLGLQWKCTLKTNITTKALGFQNDAIPTGNSNLKWCEMAMYPLTIQMGYSMSQFNGVWIPIFVGENSS